MKERAVFPVLFARVLACGCCLWASCAAWQAPHKPQAPFQPASGPVAVPAQDAELSIRHYEYLRRDGGGFLQYQLAKGSTEVRRLAAQALGALPSPEWGARVSNALTAALRDEDAEVRAAAAFGLGMRADPATIGALCAAEPRESNANARARRVEAASRFDDETARTFVFTALQDPDPIVLSEAVLGIARWKSGVRQWPAAESRLIALAMDQQCDADVRWRSLFALARQKSLQAERAYVDALALGDARARLCAAQGLGSMKSSPQATLALLAPLKDSDWRVVCEAVVALGKHGNATALDGLLAMGAHPNAHVRRVRLEALAGFPAALERIMPALETARADASPNVRAAAIETGAKLQGDRALRDLEGLARSAEARLRLAVASGLSALSPAARLELALQLADDRDLRVAAAAHEALLGCEDPRAKATLERCWRSGDNGVRLAVSTQLEERATASDFEGLTIGFAQAKGDIAPELKRSILKACASLKSPESLEFIRAALSDPDATVRRRALALLSEAGQQVSTGTISNGNPAGLEPQRDFGPLQELPAAPVVDIVTTKGTLRFRLFADETPLHVHNFLTLARNGEYTDTLFHRVVPDFVIQGGDYRGDGNGGRTFDEGTLAAEFRPRKYVRGSLGMPRNDEVDSGGSQIFVTHRETPHLDGRYTLFGQLIEGFEVLDAIEVGDRILSVRAID